ncbi:MAG: hypothetical protein JWO89_3151 [Verrucomicrobiaceae bacterium]|nr:hypothetical protein [Verrucomicrobiaceae bacterium]
MKALNASLQILFMGACVAGAASPRALGDPVKARIDGVLKQLPELLTTDPTGRAAQDLINRSGLINNAILRYFYEVPGALHETSPARDERVHQVEAYLATFEPALTAVMKATARDNEAPNAVATLLFFSKPTPTLREALLEIARDPKTDTQKAGEAYRTLFMLRLDDAEIRQEVRQKIEWRDDLHTRAELAASLLSDGSNLWGLSELEGLYRGFLSVPFKPQNYPKRGGRAKLQTQYDLAVRGLKAFGTLGGSFSQLLKARLAEMDANEDADLINSCKETILMIEGQCNPKPLVNWKGEFLGVSRIAYPAWIANQKAKGATLPKGTL